MGVREQKCPEGQHFSVNLCRLSAGDNRKAEQCSSWSCVPKVWIKETQGANGRGQKSQSLTKTTGNGALHSLGGWVRGPTPGNPNSKEGLSGEEKGWGWMEPRGRCGDWGPRRWAEGALGCGRRGRACGTYRQSGRSRVCFLVRLNTKH